MIEKYYCENQTCNFSLDGRNLKYNFLKPCGFKKKLKR